MVLDQIKDMPFEVIREQYTQYLKAQNLSPLTVQTSRTDAFYKTSPDLHLADTGNHPTKVPPRISSKREETWI